MGPHRGGFLGKKRRAFKHESRWGWLNANRDDPAKAQKGEGDISAR